MRSRVRFPVLRWGFFLEGEDFQSDHVLGCLVELGFKALPGASYVVCSKSIRIGTVVVVQWVGCDCNQS
jgi:hypothetical protein